MVIRKSSTFYNSQSYFMEVVRLSLAKPGYYTRFLVIINYPECFQIKKAALELLCIINILFLYLRSTTSTPGCPFTLYTNILSAITPLGLRPVVE